MWFWVGLKLEFLPNLDMDTKGIPKRTPNGPQMGSKIAQKSGLGPPGPPRDAKGRPEASREQFCSLLAPISEPFWDQIWSNF